jgi:hypothetical protein
VVAIVAAAISDVRLVGPGVSQQWELRADHAAATSRLVDAGAAVERFEVHSAADEGDQAPTLAQCGVPALWWGGAEVAVVEQRAARLGDL